MAGTPGKSRILLVTGRLAAPSLFALSDALGQNGADAGMDVSVLELPISVAALMTPDWALRQILKMRRGGGKALRELPDRIVMPGRVAGSLRGMEDALGVPVARGPEDLWDIPEWLGLGDDAPGEGLGSEEEAGPPGKNFRIIAEITDAWRMSPEAIIARAEEFRKSGADMIDLGGSPETGVPDVEGKITALKGRGFLVSVDTFHRETILRAAASSADMILSVNSSNMSLLELAGQNRQNGQKCKFVAVPDYEREESGYVASLEANVLEARRMGADVIADPILSPPLMGFVRSLCRFHEYRSLHPDVPMLIGSGNATELLEADSAGVNALIAACIQELGVEYVLTTEVARWARGTVRELRAARGIMRAASARMSLPKRISQALRELKGPPPRYGEKELREMHSAVTDANWRIFVTEESVCAFNRERFICGSDIAEIYAGMEIVDPSHAFYAGRELQKAAIALRLGRNYVQDDEMSWGALG
jgi:dihydropteroate synthase-like protein